MAAAGSDIDRVQVRPAEQPAQVQVIQQRDQPVAVRGGLVPVPATVGQQDLGQPALQQVGRRQAALSESRGGGQVHGGAGQVVSAQQRGAQAEVQQCTGGVGGAPAQ